jgi:amino acid permease
VIATAVLLFKTQIGLGVLSVPSVLHVLGIVPGIICLVALGVMTTWSGWMVGKFKIRHPEVYSVADVGYMLGGVAGREFIAVAYWLYMTCVVGSGLLSVSSLVCRVRGRC